MAAWFMLSSATSLNLTYSIMYTRCRQAGRVSGSSDEVPE